MLTEIPTIKGNAFTLRPWCDEDIPSLVRYANNTSIARNLSARFPHPYTERDARTFLDALADGEAHHDTCAAIELDGEAVGGIGHRLLEDEFRRTAEIGYWLGEPFWGKGIMTEVVTVWTEFAVAEHDLLRTQAIVYGWNAASGRVLEKAGYTLEGRMRNAVVKGNEVTDQLIYGKIVS